MPSPLEGFGIIPVKPSGQTSGSGTGTGTVTSITIVEDNGFAGTVTGTGAKSITLSTTVEGILLGDGEAVDALVIGSGLSLVGNLLSASGSGGTVTSVGIVAPAAGITVAGSPITVTGSITLALADDLAALEALTGTDTIYYRSGVSAWTAVTVGSGLSFTGGTLTATASGSSLLPTQTGNSGKFLTTDGTNPSWTTLGNTLEAIRAAGTYPAASLVYMVNGTTAGAITPITGVLGFLQAVSLTAARNSILAAGSGAITASGLTQNAARLIGRTTAGIGAHEEITVGTGLTFTSTTLSVDTTSIVTLTGVQTLTNKSIDAGQLTGTIAAARLPQFTGGDVTSPSAGSVVLSIGTNAVTNAKLRQSAALAVVGNSSNATANVADITAGSDGQVLRRSGTTLGFGTLAAAAFPNNIITNALLRDSTPLSVIGNATNTTSDPTDIAAPNSGNVLRRSGTTIGFGQLDLSSVDAITGAMPLTRLDINGASSIAPTTLSKLAAWSDTFGANRAFTIGAVLGMLRVSPGGRLTLTSGTPVTTADVTGASTVYYQPYLNDYITVWDGSSWIILPYTSVSLALGAMIPIPYDIFAYATVTPSLALEKLAWTNATTRATGISIQDGYYCKTGDKTRLYLGTIYPTSPFSTTEDSEARRFLWNMYNRVERPMKVVESTANWNYTTATWRAANGNANNKVEYIVGLPDDVVLADVMCAVNNGSQVFVANGVGIDSTSVNSARQYGVVTPSDYALSIAKYRGYPGIGYHVLTWLEYSAATGTTTWHANEGTWLPNTSGMMASVRG